MGVVGYWILDGVVRIRGRVGMSRGSGGWQILRGVKEIHKY